MHSDQGALRRGRMWERSSAYGSSLPQHVGHALQRAPVEARSNTDTTIAAHLDLDRLGSRWHRLLIGRGRDSHRHQSRKRRRHRYLVDLVKSAAPSENLVGIDVVLARHDLDRCARKDRRRNDLALQRLRPPLVATPLTVTCVHIRHCGHFLARKHPSYASGEHPGAAHVRRLERVAAAWPSSRATDPRCGLRDDLRYGRGRRRATPSDRRH